MTAELPTSEEAFLRRAIELAAEARAAGDDPFGSLLVGPDGSVLAEARNTVSTDRDISAHPELKLARWAARELPRELSSQAVLYTSCQPCGMCTGAIDRAGLARVVYALSNAQLAEIAPSDRFDAVPQVGPALFSTARVPIDGHYD